VFSGIKSVVTSKEKNPAKNPWESSVRKKKTERIKNPINFFETNKGGEQNRP